MIRKNCKNCGRFFYAKPCHVNRAKFCSKKCYHISMRDRITVTCYNCGEKVSKRRSNAEKNKKNFCSLDCHYKNMERKATSECNQCGEKFEHIPHYDRQYCSCKCYQKSEKLYPKTLEMRILIKQNNKTKNLHDTYIKRLLTWNNCLKPKDIPQEIVEAKRQNLKIKRLIRNKDQ